MEFQQLVNEKRGDILRLAAEHDARSVRLFGSVGRGEAGPNSDVDLLVEMEPGRTLRDMGGLLMDLQDLLGRRVDLVEPEGLHWMIRDRVLAEAKPL
ncbi:MAG: nucleotidyltransferase family protein [Armatimonadetes bacterium]|nr:nucleotidyltransferase family protein [Armatimonadota bacterium]